MLIVIGPQGGFGLVDAFGLRLIGITSSYKNVKKIIQIKII